MSEKPTKAASKFGVENTDGVDGALKKTRQSLNDWCKLHPPAFLESYLRNEICVCFKLRVRFGEVNSEDYYAVFSNFAGERGGHARNFGRPPGFSYADVLSELCDGADDEKELVFIKVVVLLDDVKNCVIRSVARVRLYRPEEFFRGTTDAIYQSVLTGFVEFFTRGTDGKLVLPSGSAAISDNKRTKQVVETRPKVVDDLARKNREARRDGRITERYKRILKPIILELGDHAIRFRLLTQEGSDLRVEISDVFFGPLNFCTTADKKITRVDSVHTELVPEITPEMIEAGMKIVWVTHIMDPREDELREMVRKVFTAMVAALPRSHFSAR